MVVRWFFFFFFSSRRRHTRSDRDWSSDVCSSDLTHQALENVKAVLAAAASSLDRVVKCTVFLVDIRDYGKMNEVYASYFPKDPPARSTVAGSGLALGARVEIECLAVAGG